MAVVTILRGLPASGKSTWAKSQVDSKGIKRVNKDDLRAMLDNGRHSKGKEKFILQIRDAIIRECLEENHNILIDDTNLNPVHQHHIEDLVAKINEWNAEYGEGKQQVHRVEYKEFTHVPLETCIERDKKRPNPVGEKVIRRMYNDWLAPKAVEFPYDSKLANCVICDLDGTLAHLNGRNPYDASTCGNDGLNTVVYDMLTRYMNDHLLFLVSGRSDKYRAETEAWLQNHGVVYNRLLMRKDGDARKDAVVKQEILDTEFRGKYNISFVLDDRNQVVEMWRANGIPCLQVAAGDF